MIKVEYISYDGDGFSEGVWEEKYDTIDEAEKGLPILCMDNIKNYLDVTVVDDVSGKKYLINWTAKIIEDQ